MANYDLAGYGYGYAVGRSAMTVESPADWGRGGRVEIVMADNTDGFTYRNSRPATADLTEDLTHGGVIGP